jgi:hypothetical protein
VVKNNSGISSEHNLSPENESLSPYFDSLSPALKELSPGENQVLSTTPTEAGDFGDTEINQVLSILFCFSY